MYEVYLFPSKLPHTVSYLLHICLKLLNWFTINTGAFHVLELVATQTRPGEGLRKILSLVNKIRFDF